MNVSKQADEEFMRLLANEDPQRYQRLAQALRNAGNIESMTEDQALTNFMLGLPTGGYSFRVAAGEQAPAPIKLDNGNAERTRNTRRRIKLARAGRVVAGKRKNVVAAH